MREIACLWQPSSVLSHCRQAEYIREGERECGLNMSACFRVTTFPCVTSLWICRDLSTEVLKKVYVLTQGKIPLVSILLLETCADA